MPEGADEAAFGQRIAAPRGPASAALAHRSDEARQAGFPRDPFRTGLAASGPASVSFDDPPETAAKPAPAAPGAAPPRGPTVGTKPALATPPVLADTTKPGAASGPPTPVASAASTAEAQPDPVTTNSVPAPAPLPAAREAAAPSGAAVEADPAAPPAAAPAAPTGPARPDGTASAPPVAPPPQAVAGLDPAALTTALIGFVADTPSEDTPPQAADRRAQREAIGGVYAARQNAPLWFADGHLTPAARAVETRLAAAAQDGLDLARFTVPSPREGDVASQAATEFALSEAVVAYARQAAGARVNVARVGSLIDFRPDVPDAARVLGTVPMASDPGAALRAFNPPQPGYEALRDKLADLRRTSDGPAPARIPYGPVLKPGMSDPRVPLIRARFHLDPPEGDPLVYDAGAAAAVAAFQKANRMPASGVLSARTVAALGTREPAFVEGDLIANMELWRWMPREQAPDRIEVNIPDYTVRVLRDGLVAHRTRVVVGQPDKPTPVFAEQMRFIIVNPYWNVPLSIIKAEMMPKLADDPNYFADHGYETVERNGVTYVRQPPGEGNALGRIKFMFPNSHAVYLHDTNARSYFARDMRALSHGCVRVEQPFSFAEAVMGRDNGWSEARIKKLIGGQERTINLPKPLPILITYFTAFVDPQTGLQTRDDVYGYVQKVKVALGLSHDPGASVAARPAKRAAAAASPVVR